LGEKIEPRLQQEMDRLQASGSSGSILPVIIELVQTSSAQSRMSDLERDFAQRATELQRYMAQIGVHGEIRPLALANSLQGSLELREIVAVAARPEVRRITWNRMEQVVA
jgi:hypothetical protein